MLLPTECSGLGASTMFTALPLIIAVLKCTGQRKGNGGLGKSPTLKELTNLILNIIGQRTEDVQDNSRKRLGSHTGLQEKPCDRISIKTIEGL
jgi:hypothetical protein